MSRRRKNAGEGYGYMFHGAFAKKADAVAKERKTKGAWVKGTPTNKGYRYIVMSPRTNPIKRKKKKETQAKTLKRRLAEEQKFLQQQEMLARARGQNPSELLVMGANPHEHQELNLPAGSTITIRVNPEPNPSIPQHSHWTAQRIKRQEDEKYLRGLQRSAREAREHIKDLKAAHRTGYQSIRRSLAINPGPTCGAMIGGYPCTRKPRHRGPHLPQGATLRPKSRHPWGPRGNPSAEAIRENFTGRAVDRVQIFDEPHMPAGDYAMLGKLLALYVKPRTGGQVITIRPTDKVVAVVDETGRQIYFVGGDQDISRGLHEFGAIDRGNWLYEVGEARRIDYKQRKEHIPHPERDEFRHDFGEDSGVRPTVLFDARAKRLLLEGGEYVIRTEGIIN